MDRQGTVLDSTKITGVRGACTGLVAGLFLLAGVAAFSASAASAAGPRTQSEASTRAVCPATFSVLHNDRIGALVLPKGAYRVAVLSATITCAQASKYFARFLQDYDGKLGGGWKARSRGTGQGTFTRNAVPMFTVDSCASIGGCSGPTPPSPLGQVCPGSFRVQNDDRIGPLSFPKGYYRLVIPKGSNVTCPQASKLFSRFLDYPSGNLPKGWGLKKTYALFFKKSNPALKKFRVDPAS